MRNTPEITLLSVGLGLVIFVALAVGIRFGWGLGMDYWGSGAVKTVSPAKTQE